MKLSRNAKKTFKSLSLLFLTFFLLLILAACSNHKIEVSNVQEERLRIELDEPAPIITKNVNWIIITEENKDEIFQLLLAEKIQPILISLTADEYENLSINMAELKRFIIEHQSILKSYKEYYEPNNQHKIEPKDE